MATAPTKISVRGENGDCHGALSERRGTIT